MKQKILMIGWEYPPVISGGLGTACLGMARALADRGHEVIFLLPHLHGNEPSHPNIHLYDVKSALSLLSETERQSFLNEFSLTEHETGLARLTSPYQSDLYQPLNVNTEEGHTEPHNEPEQSAIPEQVETRLTEAVDTLQGGYGKSLFHDVELFSNFASRVSRSMHFDICHAHDWVCYKAGLGVKAQTGKPLVVHVHATEFDRSGEKVNQYVYDLEREACHRADRVITVSNWTRSILLRHYGVNPDRVHTVYNGVDIGEMQAAPGLFRKNLTGKIVTFLGRITFQKGPDYFVRAARLVIDKRQDVHFVMAGTGDMFSRMIELAADLRLGKFFHYTGFLNRDRVKEIFAMSDIYVMPSVSEPFGISPLEAMVHGVPVIVSNQSGVSEVIENAVKVDFWNVEEVAAQILRLLEDDDRHKELHDKGHDEVKHITWEQTARGLEKEYTELAR